MSGDLDLWMVIYFYSSSDDVSCPVAFSTVKDKAKLKEGAEQ